MPASSDPRILKTDDWFVEAGGGLRVSGRFRDGPQPGVKLDILSKTAGDWMSFGENGRAYVLWI